MTASREAEAYLDQVRTELADLPDEERGELLEDLAQHLSDIAADESRAEVPLVELLGPPADYASELRTAAGLPSKGSSRARRRLTRPDLRSWLNESPVGRWANGPTGQRLLGPVVAFARELIPAWWVARAVIAVLGFFVVTASGRWQHVPVPSVFGSRLLGLALLVAAVAASVRLGRRGYEGRRRLLLAADVVIALFALSMLLEASSRLGMLGGSRVIYVANGSPDYVLASPHGPVTNIYPYDSEGNALENVLLFDQDGRPLRAAQQEWWADGCDRIPAHPVAADGVPVEFSYPLRYTIDRSPFANLPEEHRALMEQRFAQRCVAAIPRPPVPIPVFPSTAQPESSPPGEGQPPAS